MNRAPLVAKILCCFALATPAARAATAASPTFVCKERGEAPPAGDPACTERGGLVLVTGFFTSSYDQCVSQTAEADQLPPHFSPWQLAEGQAAEDPDTNSARATSARSAYCRGLYPLVNNADGSTRAWVGDDYFVKVAVNLDSEETCVKRLNAGTDIPLIAGEWKNEVSEFCAEKVKPLAPPTAAASAPAENSDSRNQGGGNLVWKYIAKPTDADQVKGCQLVTYENYGSLEIKKIDGYEVCAKAGQVCRYLQGNLNSGNLNNFMYYECKPHRAGERFESMINQLRRK